MPLTPGTSPGAVELVSIAVVRQSFSLQAALNVSSLRSRLTRRVRSCNQVLMVRSKRRGAARTLVLVLTACALAVSAAAQDRWVEVRSPNFIVLSDAGEKQAQVVAAEFEQFRNVFRVALPKAKLDPGKPLIILAVKEAKTLQELLPGFARRQGGVRPSGIFARGDEKHYAAVQLTSVGPIPRHNLYHEYVHLLNQLNFHGLPVWLNEGLAEFYANTAINGDAVEIGRTDEAHLRLLQTRGMMPLEQLLTVDSLAPEYNEADRASLFYAQAWLLTHLLLLGDEAGRAKLEALFERLARGAAPREAALETLAPLRELEQKLQDYARKSTFRTMVVRAAPDAAEPHFAVRELALAEVKALHGDFLLQTHRPVEARALLEDAVRENPNSTAAQESLGRLALLEGKHKEALAWFGRALAGNSQSYLAHYYYVMLAAENASDPDQIEQIEEHLERVIELNPQFAPAYAVLSGFYAVRPGMLNGALELARKAEELDPNTLEFSLAVGRILLRLQRVEEAIQVGEKARERAVSERDRRDSLAFLETARRYRQELAEWKREQEAYHAPAEERRKRRIEADKASSEPAAKAEPPQPKWGAGPKRRVFGSGVEGRITSVSCRGKAMDLQLDVAVYTLALHSNNYVEVGFKTAGWKPPDDFNPCMHLKGQRAIIIYTALQGKSYAGEILSIELRQ